MLRHSKLAPPASPSDDFSRVRFPPLYILILEQDDTLRSVYERTADKLRFIVSGVKDVQAARASFKTQAVNILLVDPHCRTDQGHPFIEEVKELHPDIDIVALLPQKGAISPNDAMRLGAVDHVVKSMNPDQLSDVLSRTRQQFHAARRSRILREQLRSRREMGMFVGASKQLQDTRRFILSVANSIQPVLILGEAGSGKELAARTIHLSGSRASKSFIRFECDSLSPVLNGAELFGHEKGAFRGADSAQSGLLVAADGGTLLLKEVADLSPEMQSRLFQALREKKVRPIGSTRTLPISVRILATSSKDIGRMVGRGQFRRDLFSFLSASRLKLAPLRERIEDIHETTQYILERIARKTTVSYVISEDVLRAITKYNWPANVRELENVLEYACSRCSNGMLSLRDLPVQFQEMHLRTGTRSSSPLGEESVPGIDIGLTMAEVEKRAILSTLRLTHGDKTGAARSLGIGKTTLYRKLKEYGIDEDEGIGT
jgi:DNA-binding NtrC family response regulator